jgi:predicted nucleotidyltransferase
MISQTSIVRSMDVDSTVKAKRQEILRIAAQHGATNIRLFGSRARGDARGDSDVDFLVDMPPHCSLLDIARLMMDLQDILGYKVDVVEPAGLHWYIRDRVLKEAVPL